ncbi:uncharacterized protein LOC114516168 [Dendronephthya gigantea]|uniref:uncharacterized protein LOC114516168 n=1 Tax=Dendronephthya gigantea TaxID=151771 RepID=UPI00106B77E7|nr:uncharacterized protein LOC114516168 [Dendronephthya gigantea]
MNTINSISLSFTMAILVALMSYIEGTSIQECDRVPKDLDNLYRKMAIKREYSTTRYSKNTKRRYSAGRAGSTSGVSWGNSDLRVYFNLSSINSRARIFQAHLILHRRAPSFQEMLLYRQSYRLLLKDINTSKVIYNRTVAKDDSLCLVKNLLRTVKRWRMDPKSNEGILLSVKDAGHYPTSLKTFYPEGNIKVPALALRFNPGKIFLRKKRLIASQFIQILSKKTRGSS